MAEGADYRCFTCPLHICKHIPIVKPGGECGAGGPQNNGGDTSNFIQAAYTVTRGGTQIDSGTFLNRNTSPAPCFAGHAGVQLLATRFRR